MASEAPLGSSTQWLLVSSLLIACLLAAPAVGTPETRVGQTTTDTVAVESITVDGSLVTGEETAIRVTVRNDGERSVETTIGVGAPTDPETRRVTLASGESVRLRFDVTPADSVVVTVDGDVRRRLDPATPTPVRSVSTAPPIGLAAVAFLALVILPYLLWRSGSPDDESDRLGHPPER